MKITERRLRSIIKNVIKESMEDYTHPGPSYREHDPENEILDAVCDSELGPYCGDFCEIEYDGDGEYMIRTGYYNSNGEAQVIMYKDGDMSINFREVDLAK